MSNVEAQLSPHEDTGANATNVQSGYRELKNIIITDKKRASKFRVILTHVSGVREEFITAEKATKATVTCDT